MTITGETIDYLAGLSKLRLSPSERESAARELDVIIAYMDRLNELDTADMAPMSHVLPVRNVLRPDEISPSMCRDALLECAPRRDEEAFIVPKTVE